MLFLNHITGELTLDAKCSFGVGINENEISGFSGNYFVEVKPISNDSTYYTISDIDYGEFGLVCLFNNNKLNWISISLGKNYNFPPFVITREEIKLVKQKLEDMGGENIYQWGSIELNEDIKGGIVSILIKYNQ